MKQTHIDHIKIRVLHEYPRYSTKAAVDTDRMQEERSV